MGKRTENHEPCRVDEAGVPPLDLLAETVREREHVCDQLEAIADDLPRGTDIRRIRSAMQFLKIKLPAYHRDERECLFPLIARHASQSQDIAAIIAQLQIYQIEDEGYADEVIDLLAEMEKEAMQRTPEAAGYLLRGFFQNYRRYLAWQRLTILPLAHRVFRLKDLDELGKSLRWNRRTASSPLIYLEPTANM